MIKVYPHEFERFTNKILFEGVAFFETKEHLKKAARETRQKYNIPVRSIPIPKSPGYGKRYLLMVSCYHNWPSELVEFILSQEGCLDV